MDFASLGARPIIVAVAGPNGAGKTTFYHAHVLIYDNDDLSRPYRQVAVFEQGCLRTLNEPVPAWLKPQLP
jgi:ABC-type branched-subunit amino acid transport system ATPase component